MGKALFIAEINLRQIKMAYYITMAIFLFTLFTGIVTAGNTLVVLPVIAAIIIPANNFRKIINIGGKRHDFFIGTLFVYALLAAFVALVNLLIFYTANISYPLDYNDGRYHFDYSYTIIEVIGFFGRGPVVSFIQMFVSLSFLAVLTHTLTSIQGKWYGWVANAAIIITIGILISVFYTLRSALFWFFQNAFSQILLCLLLAAAVYALSKPVLERKEI